MSEALQAAMRRAAKVSPTFKTLRTYAQVMGEDGRPVARTYKLVECVRGMVRWMDFDQIARSYGGAVGDGLASLVAPAAPGAPDLIQTEQGEWLAVQGAEGVDSQGFTLRLRVRRWTGADPVIQVPPDAPGS